MSLPIGFDKNGKAYGLLFPMGTIEVPCWEMSFYSTKRGRKIGIAYLRRLEGEQCPIYEFELNRSEIVKQSRIVPLISKDHTGKFKEVVKVDWKPKGDKRPKWKEN